MRNLFLALVLANLAFAAWHTWFAQPRRPSQMFDPGLPGITLVSEVPPDLRTARVVPNDGPAPAAFVEAAALSAPVAEVSAAAAPVAGSVETAAVGTESAAPPVVIAAAATVRCSSVGPFRDLSQAAAATASLRAAGYQPQQRITEGDIWIGYWVYIDAIPTVAAANEILATVRAEGISDSYVIPNSDSGNLVSLGVFSEISGVSRRRDEVRALGLEPQVVDRTRRANVYWVDVEVAAGQALDFDALQTPGRIARLEQRNCENTAE
jgi:cell division septation protein DedD